MKRVALVTGGSRGIGRACVERLAEDGWTVIFLFRSHTEEAEALTRSLLSRGLDVSWLRCDVGDGAALRDALAEVLLRWHRVDLLVNNAGIDWSGLLTDMTDGEWDRLFDVNLKAVFRCIRALVPGMVSRQSGCIVNIGSIWGEVGASCEAAYAASKSALHSLTRSLAKELGPSGIRVNCVSPGVIDTAMNARLTETDMAELAEETPLGRIGTPEQVAEAVAFLASERASFITGQVLGVNGGFGL